MHFDEKNKNDKAIRAMITRKIHFVKKLKVNILIDNDVFDSKLLDISMNNDILYNESCKIIISIAITNYRNVHARFVHSIKINFIISHFEKLTFIHRILMTD